MWWRAPGPGSESAMDQQRQQLHAVHEELMAGTAGACHQMKTFIEPYWHENYDWLVKNSMFINFWQKKLNPNEENSHREEKVLKARERKPRRDDNSWNRCQGAREIKGETLKLGLLSLSISLISPWFDFTSLYKIDFRALSSMQFTSIWPSSEHTKPTRNRQAEENTRWGISDSWWLVFTSSQSPICCGNCWSLLLWLLPDCICFVCTCSVHPMLYFGVFYKKYGSSVCDSQHSEKNRGCFMIPAAPRVWSLGYWGAHRCAAYY